MAHFYGRMTGQAALAVTRMGSKASGVEANVFSSDLGGSVDMHRTADADAVSFSVSTGQGVNHLQLISCVREDERIICTINPYISDTIIIK